MLALLNIPEICSMIQRLNSYSLLTDKVAENSLEQFTDQKKKQKNYQRVGNELSIKDNIKAVKYKFCLSFHAFQKKTVDFTDSAHTIY